MGSAYCETELYPPIEALLRQNGYTVHAEVLFCDISAVKDGELVVVELKTRFNLRVILQAVHRQEAADAVYVAVPLPSARNYPKYWSDIRKLCRRLGIGVFFVRIPKDGAPVAEEALAPTESSGKRRPSLRRTMLKEMEERKHNYNVGGSSKKPIMTAYRLAALRMAEHLDRKGNLSPKALRLLGTGDATASILQKNYYGWFLRVEKGLYGLSEEGKKALADYQAIRKNED